MKVKITNAAQRRLSKIDDYYRLKGNPKGGKKLRREVVKQGQKLGKHPEMGQEEENLKHLGLGHRYLVIKPFYKLIYLIIKPVVYITDIFDTRQDPKKMKP